MSNGGEIPEWVIPVIVLIIMAVAVILFIIFLIDHPFIAGLLIGLVVGIGGTIIYYRIRHWLKTHQIVEVEPPEK